MRHDRTFPTARILITAGIAAAVALGAGHATAAAAAPPPGPIIADPGGVNAPPERFGDAPTEGLRRLASAITLNNRSVTAVVAAPAGLGLAVPTEISVLFGTERVTQRYLNGAGNRLRRDFPALNGALRREPVTITLRELVGNGGSYSIVSRVDLVPQFTVTFGPLHWQEIGACDLTSKADPRIRWNQADGSGGSAEPDVDDFGEAVVPAFAATFRDVDVRTGLRKPTFAWHDDDFAADFSAPPPDQHTPLRLGTTRTVSWVDTTESDCDARFSYDLGFTARTFPTL